MGIFRLLYIIGGFLFLGSAAAHVYVRVRLRPRDDGEMEDYYYELEDVDPEYTRYTRWLHITLGGVVLGMLLLFLVFVV